MPKILIPMVRCTAGSNRHKPGRALPGGPTRQRPIYSGATPREPRNQVRTNSTLEGDGFELPVPREKPRYPIGAQLILLWLQPRV